MIVNWNKRFYFALCPMYFLPTILSKQNRHQMLGCTAIIIVDMILLEAQVNTESQTKDIMLTFP